MYLKDVQTGHLVEILGFKDLIDPFNSSLVGRFHYGEEVQDPETFAKASLQFLSGEALPRCWTDPHYRDDALKRD